MDKRIVASGVALFMVAGIVLAANTVYSQPRSFEDRRADVIGEMNSLIKEEVESGEYRCCIEPACDMCFLGHWIWSDGVCRCDDLMARGEFDKVCPQCKKGVEEGRCKSTKGDVCPLPGID